LLGWLTVVVYFTAAFLCALCAWRVDGKVSQPLLRHYRLIWTGLAAALFFLGINKQLDLQTVLIHYGRNLVRSLGWAALSQTIQMVIISGMAMGAILLLVLIGWWMRRLWRYYWMLLLGILLLARFIIVRAATFLGVPLFELSKFTAGVHVTYLLEIAGGAMISLAAWINLRRRANLWIIK
jgi:hypothetical protein